MYSISLTSIPPRFDRLSPVLDGLLAQRPAPLRVILCLPKRFRRFPGPVTPPQLPNGVELHWSDTDFGPATKAIPAARVLQRSQTRLIYCDDDWLVPSDWAAALLTSDKVATTGQAWGVDRIGRMGTGKDIAQGFSGVCICPEWLAGIDVAPPDLAWEVDDIWLSGHLARQGIPIREVPAARIGMTPAFNDTHALQNTALDGRSRDTANRACANHLHHRFGIWPARD